MNSLPPTRKNGTTPRSRVSQETLRLPAPIAPNLGKPAPPEVVAAVNAATQRNLLLNFLGTLVRTVVLVFGVSILLLIAVMLSFGDTYMTLIPVLSLLGCVAWVIMYQYVADIALPSDIPVLPGKPVPPEAAAARARRARALLQRYAVAVIAVALGLFGVFLLLGRYGLLEDFIVLFPLLALFPFSYLAYVTFQRPIRIERLKRDFELLAARWDEGLYQQSQGFWNFALHIILAIMVALIGTLIFFLPLLSARASIPEIGMTEEVLRSMRFGFIGAYLFSVQLIYRRYTTYDLQPYVYLYCALSLLAGLVVNYAVFQTIYVTANNEQVETITGLGGGLLDIIAFALGFFPLLAAQWLTRVAYTALGQAQRRSDILRLDLIDGISQLHEVRLRDNGIDNVQNLASVDIPFLLINSTFSAQQVIDWVDQAILYLYLEPSDIESFRRGRVRTVSDFRDVWGPLMLDDSVILDDDDPVQQRLRAMREEKALQLQTNTQQLDLLYHATDRGPNLQYIMNYWRNSDTLLPRWINAKYNDVLEEAFYAPDEVRSEELVKMSKQAEDYERETDGKVEPRSGVALGGLGRIAHDRYVNGTTDQVMYLGRAIDLYSEAIETNQDTNARIIAWLRELADENISQAVGATAMAAQLTGEERQAQIEQAERLIRQSIEVSKLFYNTGVPNVGYLADLAQLQISTGNMIGARETLNRASEICRTLDKPLLGERINRLMADAGMLDTAPFSNDDTAQPVSA